MNVLSLFDGMSCGQIALERAGVTVNQYYAAEVDKHAIKVTQANYPDTVQLGDVTKWREWDIDWSSIELLMGGSPCQGFSFAGKQLAFDDPRSALFFVYVDILRHIQSVNPDVKFLLENVRMKKDHLGVITEYLGVEPVFINSALVSAQNRQRYYWANWEFGQPEDRGIVLADILDVRGVANGAANRGGENRGFEVRDDEKSNALLTNGHQSRWVVCRKNEPHKPKSNQSKAGCLTGGGNAVGNHSQMDVVVHIDPSTTNQINPDKRCGGTQPQFRQRVYHTGGKSHALTATAACSTNVSGIPLTASGTRIDIHSNPNVRRLTPIECERLQTVPDGYTDHVSNSQRYKMLGNGWTVDVISWILSHM